jgi:RNA polymerase sigma factor (sigma-70 family)
MNSIRDPSPTEGLAPHGRAEGHSGLRVERLYEDYAGRLYRYCLSRLDSPEDAEDALQATYLNAWRSLNSGVEPISARPWLFAIASNVCSSILRTRLTGATEEPRSPEAFDRIPTNAAPTEDLLGLSAALAELPERQRRALLLRDWRGLSYHEIAVELDASYEAVETLLFRARKSVAAGLRAPEPARVSVRARALTAFPLLLSFKHGVSSMKSALTASVAPIKVSLGIALGAAAPLIAYGLLQPGISDPSATRKAAAPTVQVETPLTYSAPVSSSTKKPKAAIPHTKAVGRVHTASGSTNAESGQATVVSHESTSGHEGHPASPPSEPASPPGEGQAPPALVTICHHTKSKTNPDVTIKVAADAVDALLARGDTLGACAG